MVRIFPLFLLFFFFLTAFSLSALEREELWVSPVVEINKYSPDGPAALAGGFALGYGDVGSYGLRLLLASDPDSFVTLEIVAFVRLFLVQPESNTGFFLQLEGGPAFFFDKGQSVWELPVAGLMIGWRFPLGKRRFIEPALRAGHPYIVGAGLSVGFCF
jgi:hypothetical protein